MRSDAPAVMKAALLRRFDTKDYFGSITTDHLRSIIDEIAASRPDGIKAISNKKGELVDLAIAQQKATGWLPSELRTAHYDGPKAAAKPKPAAKKRAA